MKKLYSLFTLFIVCLFFADGLWAQGIYQLWGATGGGGPDDKGVLFSTKYDGSGQSVKKIFIDEDPGSPGSENTPVLYNNNLYCLLSEGGDDHKGVIAVYEPVSGAYTKKADLSSLGTDGSIEYSLTVFNGKLYGLARSSDVKEAILFEFDPATNALTKKYTFADGQDATGDLVLYNNKLYGMATIEDPGGTFIYEYNPANNQFTQKITIDPATTGIFRRGSFAVYNNKLWATIANSGFTEENIFSYDPATNVFSKKALIISGPVLSLDSKLAVYNNKLYGTTTSGGIADKGILYEYDPLNNSVVKKVDFTSQQMNACGPLTVLNNKLYAHTPSSDYGKGGMYEYNPANNSLVIKFYFGNSSGIHGCGSLAVFNNRLYGLTANMANYGNGCLYAYDPVTPTFDKVVEFGGTGVHYPGGRMIYYNNKIYGTCSSGGNGEAGGIYTYDIVTGVFTIKHHVNKEDGYFSNFSGITLFNNKFYGVTSYGGANGVGSLIEYDPATDDFLKIRDFDKPTGSNPSAALTAFNGKLYGSCVNGSTHDAGNIFQYDPVTQVYSEKVIFNGAMGSTPQSQLLEYNGRLYGTTSSGGTHDYGVIFEYFPQANGYTKLADFEPDVTGQWPMGQLCVYKNKLYGTTFALGSAVSGLFCYDFAAHTLIRKLTYNTYPEGKFTQGGLTLLNNKMYGTTQLGGDLQFGGTLFEYDPESNISLRKTNFTGPNGQFPGRCVPTPIPALVAPGSAGSCVNTTTVDIQTTKSHDWIAFTDNQGRAVAEINANGNVLGNTTVRYFINDGNVRKDDKGTFYLDRNITISVANQPTTPVSIRLYVRKEEFETLQATAGSGVVTPSDIAIFHNKDFCAAEVDGKAYKEPTAMVPWGNDYVYIAHVSSFSSFYFATNTALTLPIHIESFSGKMENAGNLLSWKASCTNAVDFTLERSADGIHFTGITTIAASQQDCALPFTYNDAGYLPGKNYYRLMMNEQGSITYSKAILLDRVHGNSLQIKVLPNPVTGTAANLQISSPNAGIIELFVTDMTGKSFLSRKLQTTSGTHNTSLPVGALPAGVYCIRYFDGQLWQSTKFIKQ